VHDGEGHDPGENEQDHRSRYPLRHLASTPLPFSFADLAALVALPGQLALTLLLTRHPPNPSVIDR
jgi:hypothetical protein